MRPIFVVVLAALATAPIAPGAGTVRAVVFTVKTMPGPTIEHAHPPTGMVGDTFVSSLELENGRTPQLGRPARAAVGTMQFTYTIRRQCTSFGTTCVATADFDSVSTLPGGTVDADGNALSIADPTITIPVTGGTGRYAGATGTVSISPTSTTHSTYRLELPS